MQLFKKPEVIIGADEEVGETADENVDDDDDDEPSSGQASKESLPLEIGSTAAAEGDEAKAVLSCSSLSFLNGIDDHGKSSD